MVNNLKLCITKCMDFVKEHQKVALIIAICYVACRLLAC